MRSILYIFLVWLVLMAGVMGLRGCEWSHEPLAFFDDMAVQDRIGSLDRERFHRPGAGMLPPGTVPSGWEGGAAGDESPRFTTRGGSYAETGVWEGYYGQGLPRELLPEGMEGISAFLKQGRTAFENHCAVCHGESGNGKGVAASYEGFPVLADLNEEMYQRSKYPDGRLFFVITHGLGNMSPYGAVIPIRERWSIVGYLRVLQRARNGKGKMEPGAEQ